VPSPSPPPEVQALCSVIVWYSPELYSELTATGYDVLLFDSQQAYQNVSRRVAANGTFYITSDEERLTASHVQVLVQWLACINYQFLKIVWFI
jgi:predicted transcriptional regulator